MQRVSIVIPARGNYLTRRIQQKESNMNKLKFGLAIGFAIFLVPTVANAQTPADAAAIKQTALDYIEGYYEGNAERM